MDEILKERLLDLLSKKPLENIIMIADCTQLLPWCGVRILIEDDSLCAAFSLYKDLDFLAGAFWTENTECLRDLIVDSEESLKGRDLVFICTQQQLELIRLLAQTINPIQERQMVLDTCEEVNSWGSEEPEPLDLKDEDELRALYRICGTPAWTSQAMNLGPFYGIRKDSQIVAVAGVHFVTKYGAELGNVATHPKYRGKGFASECVKKVVCELEKLTPTVVLHFFDENTAAKALYLNMGFRYSETDPVYFTKIRFKNEVFS